MYIDLSYLISKYKISFAGVLHIGAHWGEEAEDYYNNGAERTTWIEANPHCMPVIKEALKAHSNVTIFNECLSDKDREEVEFKISNNEGLSSSILDFEYHKIAYPQILYIDNIKLLTKRLDTLFTERNLFIKDYQFVNIDVQGAELIVLKGFGQMLNDVKYLYLEINERQLYKDCALVGEIDEYLKDFGFVKKEQTIVDDSGWGDAFYINKQLLTNINESIDFSLINF